MNISNQIYVHASRINGVLSSSARMSSRKYLQNAYVRAGVFTESRKERKENENEDDHNSCSSIACD